MLINVFVLIFFNSFFFKYCSFINSSIINSFVIIITISIINIFYITVIIQLTFWHFINSKYFSLFCIGALAMSIK